jgi:hypothetical protein
MPFVNEVISEEVKNSFDFSIVDPSYRRRLKPSKWAIDRERNAVLVWIKQDREPPHCDIYAFIWKGLRFEPWVLHSNIKTDSDQWLHTCRIENVFLPKGFPVPSKDNDEMLVALEEALLVAAKADYSNPEDVEKIRIENPFNKGVQQ